MQGDFVIRRVGSWNCALYAARSYADAHGLKPEAADLSKAEIITWNEESAHLRGGPWFSEHAAHSAIAFTANKRRIHFGGCKAGLGAAFLPCLAAGGDPGLVSLVPPERFFWVDLWLVFHRYLFRTPRVRV